MDPGSNVGGGLAPENLILWRRRKLKDGHALHICHAPPDQQRRGLIGLQDLQRLGINQPGSQGQAIPNGLKGLPAHIHAASPSPSESRARSKK
jgi:hypothetical protein